MTTLTIKIPDNKTTTVSAYVKKLGGEVVNGKTSKKGEPVAGDEGSHTLVENEMTIMSLTYAEKAFSPGWDVTDQKANAYWDSFL